MMALSRVSASGACNRFTSLSRSSSSSSTTSASTRLGLETVLLGKQPRLRSSPLTYRTMSTSPRLRSLNIDNINPHVRKAEYAVRGELAVKSEAYRAQLASGDAKDLPFDDVISANIGNPQQLDQKPITFFRQVLSLLEYPPLLEKEDVLLNQLGYKKDVIERAKWLLSQVGSVGAYSASTGPQGIRESIAKFIENRDGHPADPASIYLSAGASSGVNTLLHVICAGPKTGVLVPIPQYPLYTATLSLLDATCVPYYLDEANHWSTSVDSINSALATAKEPSRNRRRKAKKKSTVASGPQSPRERRTTFRAIAIINPGNPTGASLSYEDIESVIDLAAKQHLVILADEVYQTNVFIGKFHSFKAVLRDMQKKSPGKYDTVELVSLHSVSKGIVGECGHRGGYFELCGFDPEVVAQIYKFVSISLCAPVIGQCLVELMVHPPVEGEPSYDLYKSERLHLPLRTGHRPVSRRADGPPSRRGRAILRALQDGARWHLRRLPVPRHSAAQGVPEHGGRRVRTASGIDVPLPHHHAVAEGEGGRGEGRQDPGCVLCDEDA
ncbi:hypothetical protein V495_04202 [Pseudogymnoascus sp. VKM F-4514 (FW-929)]|nr:hypothetical protein V495_04202 [Pseudogymnoascus sp. VKM F-4514 (FW-929)]